MRQEKEVIASDKNYPEMFPNAKAHLMVFRDGITIVINAIEKNAFLSRYHRENVYDNVWIGDTLEIFSDKAFQLGCGRRFHASEK